MGRKNQIQKIIGSIPAIEVNFTDIDFGNVQNTITCEVKEHTIDAEDYFLTFDYSVRQTYVCLRCQLPAEESILNTDVSVENIKLFIGQEEKQRDLSPWTEEKLNKAIIEQIKSNLEV